MGSAPLYSSTICKSWIQLFAVSIFALPNKSPPFRLSHFASENLLNVYVLHFLDKQWFWIRTTNNRFEPSKKRWVSKRIFFDKQKTFTIFLGTIHGSHRESKLGLERLKKWVFVWTLKQIKFWKEKGVTPYWPPVPTSRGTNQPKRYYRDRTPSNFIY